MDKWLHFFYGRKNLPRTAIICTGTTTAQTQNKIFVNAEILNYKSDVQDYYIQQSNGNQKTLIFNVIGSPVLIDIINVLAHGGTKEIYFLSFAGTNKDYQIGDYFVPTKVRCLDGLTQYYEPGINSIDVSKSAYGRVVNLFQNGEYHSGISASVPSLFHNHKDVKEALAKETNITAIEMEASVGLYFSNYHGIECLPILIISDNKREDIPDGFERRELSLCSIVRTLCDL